MKLFKIFFSFFIIAIAVFVVSRFFPHAYKVACKISINRPVDDVYSFMSDFRNWEKWSLWNKSADSTLIYFYGKTSKGLEGHQYFYGKNIGQGQFRFDTCLANEKLVYRLNMHAGEIKANGTFLFESNGDGTTLSWINEGDVGSNPIYRFMIPSKTESTRKTFDDGLGRIKEILESSR
jgi:hypothetical protein